MLTLVAGLPLAWAIGRFRFRGRSLVRALVLVPFVLPTVVVATAFLIVLPDGYERGLWAILAAHVFFNVAVVTRIVGSAWATIDPRSAEAAAVLGAGPLRRVREVTLPQLGPRALRRVGADVPLLLHVVRRDPDSRRPGPGDRGDGDLQPGRAHVRPAGGGRAVVAAARRRGGRAHGGRHPRGAGGWRRHARRRERRAPPAARVGALRGRRRARRRRRSRSSSRSSSSLERSRGSWGALFEATPALLVEPWEAAVFSVFFAGVAAAIALVVGGLAAIALARRPAGVVDGFVLLPLGASAVMLGFGFLIAFDEAPVDFRSSWWLVPVAQSLIAAPFVVRIVTPALRSIDPALREVAATLGASPLRSRREIDTPLVGRAFAVAAGFAFAIALGEFGATVFVARAEQPTLPVAIFRFLGRPGEGNQGVAAALAVVLAVIAACAALLAERVADGRGRAL